ncbi:hypothetical protein QBC39DRAFT_376771 [Podospora conica]|nr:hypothetical protein QBC39DRAFT_376771 [Schizothecium conicum]
MFHFFSVILSVFSKSLLAALDHFQQQVSSYPRPPHSSSYHFKLIDAANIPHQLALVEQWRASPLKAQIDKETSDTISDLLKVWKTFGQYFRCVPTDIFGNGLTGSPTHRLCIDLSSQRKIKDPELLQYSPLWPASTCKALLDVMWHPLWRDGEVRSLVLALQMAVIARTDDRTTWDFHNHTDSKFLDRLREEIDAERTVRLDKRRSVGELCRRAHEREPRLQTSDWFLLFTGLANVFKGGRGRTEAGGSFYVVRTIDINAVETALRNLGSYDIPHPVGGPLYREVFSDDTKSTSAPSGMSRFAEVLGKVAMNSMRTKLIENRAMTSDVSTTTPPQTAVPSPVAQGPGASLDMPMFRGILQGRWH